MIKEIKYNGYSANPSDYECADGDLAIAMNLIPENGVLKSVQKPKCLFTLSQGKKVIYIHNISTYKHYIIHDTESETLQWLSSNDINKQPENIVSISGRELYQVTSLGNTLIILTSDGIIYTLYKSDTYILMGSNPVFPSLSFRLRASTEKSNTLSASFPGFYINLIPGALLSADACQSVKDTVLSYTNKYTADAKTAGLFQYPFMIRYAYRMYDGTLNYISSPIKIYPSYGTPFLITYEGNSMSNNQYVGFNMSVLSVVSKLYYKITNFDEVKKSMSEWSELIRSIDIFITPPLYTIDQDNMCKSIFNYGPWGSPGKSYVNFSYCANSKNENNSGELIYRRHDASEFTNPLKDMFFGMLGKPLVDDDSSLPFYLISSIDVKEIQSGENIVSIEKEALNSLEAKEVMEGDSNLVGTIVAKHAFPYNARLNLTGVTIIPPKFPLESCFEYANGEYDDETKKAIKKTYSYKAYIFIEAEKRKVMVQLLSGIQMNIVNSYFFYPNINAKELIIERIDGDGTKSYSYNKLYKHETLNGVYGNINTIFSIKPDMNLITDTEIGITYLNKIYTSDVNDPFSFPATGVCAVGIGTIIGLSSAAKALSQGQFGQFPLYCFSTDGIWALEISSTGSYSARQPITRDICVNTDSITQIDNAVLFATDRGIMLISGSRSQCISDILDCELAFSVSSLPHLNKLINNTEFNSVDFQFLTFHEFLKKCKMIYDYTNQRIIIYNPSCTYAYLYSMKSKQWGMMCSNIVSNLNSYPEALAMTSNNELVIFSQGNNTASTTSLAVTRPFKMDDLNIFKTINTIIQRGYFKSSHITQVLYGSNDLFNWHVVWSSTDKYLRGFRGTPYKAFRLALICTFDKSESLLGFSVQFNPRMLNRLR